MTNTPEQSTPPPLRWFKRCWQAFGVTLLAAVMLRLVVGCYTQHCLNAAADRYRAAGYPLTIEELDAQQPAVPDDQNAALLLEQAAALLPRADAKNQAEPLWHPMDHILAGGTSASKAPSAESAQHWARFFTLVRQARQRPKTQWTISLNSVLSNPDQDRHTQPVQEINDIIVLFNMNFEHALQDQQYNEALAITLDLFALAKHLHLIPGDSWAVQARRLQDTGYANLRTVLWVSGLPEAQESVDQLLGQFRTELLPVLTCEDIYPKRCQQIFLLSQIQHWQQMTERTTAPTRIRATGHHLGDWVVAWLVQPQWQQNRARWLDSHRRLISKPFSDRWPEVRLRLRALDRPDPFRFVAKGWLSQERPLDQVYRDLAQQRLAATAVAIRLYQRDHGRRPSALSELVPDYLSSVPSDPGLADDTPLGYWQDHEPPLLYSVGLDGQLGSTLPERERHPPRPDDGDLTFQLAPTADWLRRHEIERSFYNEEGGVRNWAEP